MKLAHAALVMAAAYGSAALAQHFGDPSGLYISAADPGTAQQWYLVQASEDGRFAVSDLFGRGLQTDFADGRATQVDANRIAVNAQSSQPALQLFRSTQTDSGFPLLEENFVPPSPLLQGAWDIEELLLDPISGAVLPQFDGSLVFIDVFTLSVVDSGLRFTDSRGTYFQGPMHSGTGGSFRRVRPLAGALDPQAYRTTPGSAANFSRDIIGQMRFSDLNHFHVLLALQTYSASAPEQFLLSIDGTRRNPISLGDVDANGSIDAADRSALIALLGLRNASPGFNLAADMDGNGYVDLRDLAAFDQRTLGMQAVVGGISGLWFNPERPGEGWDTHVLSDGSAYVAWFTYTTEGEALWLVGSGVISGNQIDVPEFLIATQGTRFGIDYDPDEVVLEVWGSGLFHFNSCIEGGMAYAGPAGFGNGSIGITRLSAMAGVSCAGSGAPANAASAFSGIWFDPAQPFQGWLIHGLADDQAVITWYSYDGQGQPFWLIGNGSVAGNVLTIVDLLSIRGPRFGSQFDPADALRSIWGDLQFTRSGCNAGQLNYISVREEFGSGSLQPVRLGAIDGLECVEAR